jgi:hypothetical protein
MISRVFLSLDRRREILIFYRLALRRFSFRFRHRTGSIALRSSQSQIVLGGSQATSWTIAPAWPTIIVTTSLMTKVRPVLTTLNVGSFEFKRARFVRSSLTNSLTAGSCRFCEFFESIQSTFLKRRHNFVQLRARLRRRFEPS